MPAGLSILEPPFLGSHFLARLQFAFTVSFHIVFPVLTIGLAGYLAVLEGLWLKTGRAVDLDPRHFWSRGFAVAFGMDVVFGLVMATVMVAIGAPSRRRCRPSDPVRLA